MPDKDKISVITVSYNAENTIRKTIESVLYQTYPQVEYIIIDGESTDATYRIICEYDEQFKQRGIPYIHISEPDNGIYDAMNKALNYCSGEWVNYLNADDRFFQDSMLETVFSQRYGDDISCIYGNTWYVRGKKQYKKYARDINVICYKMPFIHQSTFIRKKVMCKYKFNTDYKICADYDLFLRMYLNGEKYKRIDCDIAFFDVTGVSNTESEKTIREWKRVQIRNGLNKRYLVRRFFQNNIVYALKKSKLIFSVYILYMNIKEKFRRKCMNAS